MKKVHFCTKVRVRKYSKDEAPISKWYTQQDLDRIDQEIETTVILMRMNIKSVITREICHQEIQRILHESDEDGYYCSRGLEYRIPYLGAQRSQNKKLARDAILDEQRLILQNNQASLSPGSRNGRGATTTRGSSVLDGDFAERLSKVYRIYSHGCHEDAAMRGAMDEQVARKINHDNDEYCYSFEIGSPRTQQEQDERISNERWRNGGPSDTPYEKSQIRRRVIPQLDFKKSSQKEATSPPAAK